MNKFSRSQIRRAETWVLLILLTVALVWVLAAVFVGGDKVVDLLSQVARQTIFILLLLSLINYGLRCIRWIRMTRWMGLPLPVVENSLYYIAGLAFGPTPGKIGDALRLWLMGRHYRVRMLRLAPLFIGDRLGDMNAIAILAVAGSITFPDHWGWSLSAAGFCGLLTLAVIWPRPVFFVTAKLYPHLSARWAKILVNFRRMLRDSADLMSGIRYLLILFISLIGWAAEALAFHLLLVDLGAGLNILQATFVFTFSVIVGGASLTPGGVGSTEATMIALLSLLGVDFERALVATAVIRATSLWFGTLLGFGTLPFVLRRAQRAAMERSV